MTTPKKRGGWRNPASAANGRNATPPPRKVVRQLEGVPAFVLRDGDTVIDGTGTTIATAALVSGALRLTAADGRVLTIVLAE